MPVEMKWAKDLCSEIVEMMYGSRIVGTNEDGWPLCEHPLAECAKGPRAAYGQLHTYYYAAVPKYHKGEELEILRLHMRYKQWYAEAWKRGGVYVGFVNKDIGSMRFRRLQQSSVKASHVSYSAALALAIHAALLEERDAERSD